MANSFIDNTGDNSTTLWSVPFPFIKRADVDVIDLSDDSAISFTWVSDTQIQISPAVSSTINFRIRRTTSRTARVVDFQDATNLNEATLDLDSNQLFYILQETVDSFGLQVTMSNSGISTTLPTPEALKILRWNNALTALENVVPADLDLTTVSSFIATLLDDSSQEDALTTLISGASIPTVAVSNADKVIIQDADDSNNVKTVLASDIVDLVDLTEGYNIIDNGNFSVAQKGTSVGLSASTSMTALDRWHNYQNGGSASDIIVSQQAGENSPFCMRVLRNAGTVTDTRHKQHIITEEAKKYAGKEVTFSFRARKGSGYSPVNSGLTAVLITGAGSNQGMFSNESGVWTSQAYSVAQVATLTTSFQTFTYTVTLPANTTEIAIGWHVGWAGTGGTTDYFEIEEAQLEVGSQKTPFPVESDVMTLARCKPHFFKIAVSLGQRLFSGYNQSTAQAEFPYRYPVRMVKTPTITYPTPSTNFEIYQGSTVGINSLTLHVPSDEEVLFYTGNSGLTAGNGCALLTKLSSTYIDFDAEYH